MPRKTLRGAPHGVGGAAASMRPRPDAAENDDERVGGAGVGAPASMRPRPDAAENFLRPRLVLPRPTRFNEAAARCRGKLPPPARRRRRPAGFNEAAARCRGKPGQVARQDVEALEASMRPRPDAAENLGGRGTRAWGCRRCFNEAAARCRGKLQERVSQGSAGIRFNEAAARCRGKRRAAATSGPTPPRGFNEAAARCRGKHAL